MSDHTKQPRLCGPCADRAHALAAKSDGTAHLFCNEHRVLATMQVRAGRIVGWFVAGPVTDLQRDAMLAEVKARERSTAPTAGTPATPGRRASIYGSTYVPRF